MERCPLCKARLRNKTTCRRCEADLGLLKVIESRADHLAQRAVFNLLEGKTSAARKQAIAARQLHATQFHKVLAGFIETMTGEECVRQNSEPLEHTRE